jgi:hypothetical protein
VTRYALLVELARREHELVADGRAGELASVHAEREALLAALPAQAPGEARPYLERALELTLATQAELVEGLGAVRRELVSLGTQRRLATSYTGVAPAVTLDARA